MSDPAGQAHGETAATETPQRGTVQPVPFADALKPLEKILNAPIDIAAAKLDAGRAFIERHDRKQPARLWIGIGALLGAIVAGVLAGYLQRDFGKRNLEYFPDMAYSKAWESQLKNDYFAEYDREDQPIPQYIRDWGTAEMPPPPGTVYRGQRSLELGKDKLMDPATTGMLNPVALRDLVGDRASERDKVLARGKVLFRQNCQACHGVDGIGGAPVTDFGIGAPAINTGVVRDRWKDGQLFNIISNGYNTMPAHASHVEYDERWKLITYLRSLQEGK